MHRIKHTIFLASALLKHWFCMWLAAQMSVSSSSWVNRFTALSNVISGGLFSDFLCEDTAMNDKMYHSQMSQNAALGLSHTSGPRETTSNWYMHKVNTGEFNTNKHTILQWRDIVCLYPLNGEFYFDLLPIVHHIAGDWGWVWLWFVELLALPPEPSQPGQAFIRLASTKHPVPTSSLHDVFLLFDDRLVVTPLRAVSLLKRCICKHRCWWCCLSERPPAEVLECSRGGLRPGGAGGVWEGVATKWIRTKWAVQHGAGSVPGSRMGVGPMTEGTKIEATARKHWTLKWRYLHPPGWSLHTVTWNKAVSVA